MAINKRRLGTEYEDVALKYIESLGGKLIEKNYRNHYGEIDIIYQDTDGTICYTEIKYRSSRRYGHPIEAVDARKQRRISRVAAFHYAYYCAKEAKPCRFDVIGIDSDGAITHVKNAFDAVY